MRKGIAEVRLRMVRGKLVVQTMGKTPRGRKFLRGSATLPIAKTTDKKFKVDLASAVDALLVDEDADTQ